MHKTKYGFTKLSQTKLVKMSFVIFSSSYLFKYQGFTTCCLQFCLHVCLCLHEYCCTIIFFSSFFFLLICSFSFRWAAGDSLFSFLLFNLLLCFKFSIYFAFFSFLFLFFSYRFFFTCEFFLFFSLFFFFHFVFFVSFSFLSWIFFLLFLSLLFFLNLF